MPKLKSHKGLLKRVKVTGTGKVKFHKRGKRHRNSHMSGDTIRGLNRPGMMCKADVRALEKVLHRRLKGADQA